MKKEILIILILITTLLIGCSNQTEEIENKDNQKDEKDIIKQNEEIEKITIKFINGSYILTDSWSDLTIDLNGEINLKICNNGEKIMPFKISKDIGNLEISFPSEALNNKIPTLVERWQNAELKSVEGLIEISPKSCPTYKFIFTKSYPVTIEEIDRKDLIERKYFNDLKISLYLTGKESKLKGINQISLTTEKLKEKGLIKEDNGKIKVTNTRPDKQQFVINETLLEDYEKLMIECFYKKAEFEICQEEIKEILCKENDCSNLPLTTDNIDIVIQEYNELYFASNDEFGNCFSNIDQNDINNYCENNENDEDCNKNFVIEKCEKIVKKNLCENEKFKKFDEYLKCN